MERKINLNMQASGYVPRNQRAQPKYDNANVEVIYEYEGGKRANTRGDNYYQDKNSQVDYGNQGYQNNNQFTQYEQYYNYDKYAKKGKGSYNEQSHDQQNYNTYSDQSQGQYGYHHGYYDKTCNEFHEEKDTSNYNYQKNQNQLEDYSNKKGQRGKNNYTQQDYNQSKYSQQDYYKQNYNQQTNISQNYNQNYNQQNYKQQNYNQQNYNQQKYNQQNYDQQNCSQQNYHQQNYNQQNYDQQNSSQQNYDQQNYSQQNYSQQKNFNKKGKYNKQNKNYQTNQSYQTSQHYEEYQEYNPKSNKGRNNYQVVEKDVSNIISANKQDLEDDMFEETYVNQSELTGLTGEEYYEDDLNDDYAFGGNEDGDFDDYYQETSNKFGNFSISENAKHPSGGYKESESNSKNKLVFNNKEGFTNYVEELIKNEKKNYPQITDDYVNILMIAEKPSIAKSISEAIGGKSNSRRLGKGACIINFDGFFGSTRAKFTVSSVMGHVYTSDFQKQHNNWDSVDYLDLYDVPVEKIEANKKTYIPSTLNRLAQGKDILCLWLDCDKEGENICYEVIYNCYPYMKKRHYQQIYRAKFSSLTKTDLKAAFNKMSDRPNKFESLSVDARQVIDLKIGVSFTRFLTSAILPGIKGTDTKFLSYGPCQTPTLWFCVNRQREINSFKSKEFHKIFAEFEINKIKHRVGYKKKFFDKVELNTIVNLIRDEKTATVSEVLTNKHKKETPVGLNTVQMLRVASSYLKMSPHETMHVAEKLYTGGYITYPRTETTKYASSFDFVKSLSDFSSHPTFGKAISSLLKNFKRPALRGVDVGDHPPITPSRVASPSELKGDHWRLYEFICANFFASLAEPAEYEEKVFQISINGEIFEADSMLITKEGFLAFMPWKRGNYMKDFPVLSKNSTLSIIQIFTESDWTSPPDYLSESDLIKMMEQNKIGTDASMPVHIQNICERGYVKVDANRRLIPTKLGKALIESLSAVDPEIVQPSVRAEIENYVDQVAKGNKKFEEVLSYAIELYKKKFLVVRQHYEKLLNSFKKYFDVDLMEMNKVYMNIKSKNEALKLQNRVRKTLSQVDTDLKQCHECSKGHLYIEYDNLDKYLLYCTSCNLRKKIVRDAVKLKVHKNLQCQNCNSNYIEVEVENPFLSGEKTYAGCLFCDPNLK